MGVTWDTMMPVHQAPEMTLEEALAELRYPTVASRQNEAVNYAVAVLAALAGEQDATK